MPSTRNKSICFFILVFFNAFYCFLHAAASETELRKYKLPEKVNFVGFVEDETRALLVSNETAAGYLVDLSSGRTRHLFGPASNTSNEIYTDMAMSSDRKTVYLVGISPQHSQQGVIRRISIGNRTSETADSEGSVILRLADRLVRPSIVVSENGSLYLGDFASSVISVLSISEFEQLSRNNNRALSPRVKLSDLRKSSIFLENGPVTQLALSSAGDVLFASHVGRSLVSAVATHSGRKVMEIKDYEKAVRILPVVMAGPQTPNANGMGSSMIFGSSKTLAIFDIRNEWRTKRKLPARFSQESLVDFPTNRSGNGRNVELILDSDISQENIVFTFRGSNTLFFFWRSSKMDIGFTPPIKLGFQVAEAKISTLGDRMLLLADDGRTLYAANKFDKWLKLARLSASVAHKISTRVRRAQIGLDFLRYDVGFVDGILGRKTQKALRIFQKLAGLPVTGIVDDETLAKITKVVGEYDLVAFNNALEDISGNNSEQAKGIFFEKVKNGCTREHNRSRCDVHPGSSSVSGFTRNDRIEERHCSSVSNVAYPVQADIYISSRNNNSYVCTRFHSCAFLRFRQPSVFDSLCMK